MINNSFLFTYLFWGWGRSHLVTKAISASGLWVVDLGGAQYRGSNLGLLHTKHSSQLSSLTTR